MLLYNSWKIIRNFDMTNSSFQGLGLANGRRTRLDTGLWCNKRCICFIQSFIFTQNKKKTWLQALAILFSFLFFSFWMQSLLLICFYIFSCWPVSEAALELGVDECSSYSIVTPLLLSSPKMRLEIGWHSLFAKIKI